MTEAASQVATQPLHARQRPFGDVALDILPHWQLRCTDEQRLSLSGPSLFSGELLAQADGTWQWQPRADDWFTSQDRVELLPARQLRVLGRSDFIVKILGELVDPLTLESQLVALGLPEAHFALIAAPDARREHALCLCYESAALPAAAIAEALQRYHQHCAGHLRITQLAACTAFPRSDLGKIRREQLRLRVLERGTEPVG
jgi:acyl-coenzyme A synthetase/AMP-(fatty) acid ligase